MRHEFAFYTDQLSGALANMNQDTIAFADEQLWHRLKHVVRAKVTDTLSLFDRSIALEVTLASFGAKNQLSFCVVHRIEKKPLYPKITILLPLLKRDSLQEALYSCVELGANEIQLVTTEKTSHAWSPQRDMPRCEKIMLAAAEQSKQFVLPILNSPIPLPHALAIGASNSFRIQCDPKGASLWKILDQIEAQKPATIVLSFGPEGDFTQTEKDMLESHHFVPCALTPTVLRATQALVVTLGALRSGF